MKKVQLKQLKLLIQNVIRVLYDRQCRLSREDFTLAVTSLSVITMALYGLVYAMIAAVDPDSFINYPYTLSYCFILFLTSIHAMLISISMVHRRIEFIECNPLYTVSLFIPYLKVLLLVLLLAPHGDERYLA